MSAFPAIEQEIVSITEKLSMHSEGGDKDILSASYVGPSNAARCYRSVLSSPRGNWT